MSESRSSRVTAMAITYDPTGLFASAVLTFEDGEDQVVSAGDREAVVWLPMGVAHQAPALTAWKTEDLQMMAGLIVNAMVSTIEELLDAPLDSPEAEDEIVHTAEKQLRLVALGVPAWRSG